MTSTTLAFERWRSEPAPRSWKFRALLCCALLLLVPHVTGALPWLYENAALPVKPRDWTLILSGLTLLLIAFSRPGFCLPALGLFIIPFWRLADVALLQRYRVESLPGGPESYMMILVGNYLVTATAVLVLTVKGSTRIATWFASAAILVCAGTDLVEGLGLHAFTRIPGRVSGFLEDPNQSPITMCLLLGVLFAACRRFWWNISVAAVASVAVVLTLSRSGMAIFSAMILAYVAANLRRHFKGLLALTVVAIPLAIAGVTIFSENVVRKGGLRNDE